MIATVILLQIYYVAQKVLLYGTVNTYSAKQFVTDLNALSGKDKEVHINGDGGEVKYGLACLTNLAKAGNVTLINDAEANSMFAFMFCYPASSKKCADYSTFGFHRAAYPSWFESDPELFDAEAKTELAKINAKVRAAMEGAVDARQWMLETGCSLDDLFSMDSRKEVIVDAAKAKRLGLVDEIFSITPAKRNEVNALRKTIEAKFSTPLPIAAENKHTTTTMAKQTLAEFKAENPELLAEIITAERERCEAWADFADVDPKVVADGIKSGKNITVKIQGEMLRKQLSAEAITKVEAENPEAITVEAKKALAEKTLAEKNAATIEATIRKNLGLPTTTKTA